MIDDQILIHPDQILQSFSSGMLGWGPLVEEKNGMCTCALWGGCVSGVGCALLFFRINHVVSYVVGMRLHSLTHP